MKHRVLFVISVLVVAAGALALRLPKLGMRPMHTDEAVHAYKLGELIEKGYYKYDPVEYHGPTLNYLTLPVTWLRGIHTYADLDEQALRIVPVVFGVLLVVGVLGLGDGLGRRAAVCAALLTAVSTGLVLFSRYYIMEMLLVSFTLWAIVAGWRFVKHKSVGWCVVAGAAVGLMHATKETWVLVPAAMAVAMGVNLAWGRWVSREPVRLGSRVWDWRLLVGLAVAVAVSVVFFSSFFTNADGPLDSILTYVHGLRRAAGEEGVEAGNLHVHPWHFYARIVLWYRVGRGPISTEVLIVGLAVVGTVAGFLERGLGRADPKLVRFLGVYSFVLAAIYSVIPYKTPWCILGALHGMVLVAGVGAVALVRWVRPWPVKAVVSALLLTGGAQLAWQAWRANYSAKFYDSNYIPWIYGHTLRGAIRLANRVEELAELSPDGHDMPIKVYTPSAYDQWPLPWYLRRFNREHIGYFFKVPDDADAPVIIFSPELWEQIEPKLKRKYRFEHHGLRPAVVLVMGIRSDLWEKFIEKKKAEINAKKGRAMTANENPPPVARAEPAEPLRFSHRAMACMFEVLIPAAADSEAARSAAEAAFEELDRLEKQLSRFNVYGDVGRINVAGAGEPVVVEVETCECLAAAQRLWSQTGGAFDVTAGVPPAGEQADGDRRIGMKLLAVDADALTVRRLDAAVKVDLGGIGKGYALDRMAEVLGEWGVEAALINGGSSTALATGPRGDGPWRVALRDPLDADAEPLGWISLAERAFSGSATVHARHITDPRTGRAVARNRAAWAVTRRAVDADALTTAFCVMSSEELQEFSESHKDLSFIVAVRQDGAWRLSKFGPPMLTDDGT